MLATCRAHGRCPRRQRGERKVRAPQGSVAVNHRRSAFRRRLGTVQQKASTVTLATTPRSSEIRQTLRGARPNRSRESLRGLSVGPADPQGAGWVGRFDPGREIGAREMTATRFGGHRTRLTTLLSTKAGPSNGPAFSILAVIRGVKNFRGNSGFQTAINSFQKRRDFGSSKSQLARQLDWIPGVDPERFLCRYPRFPRLASSINPVMAVLQVSEPTPAFHRSPCCRATPVS